MDTVVASQALIAACLAPEKMSATLQDIAIASGAEGTTITYSHGPLQVGALTSEALLEHIAPYLSTNRPRDPRPHRVNPTLDEGFRLDQDDFTREELARDPFYQEFLRPRGIGWHACAMLATAPDGKAITLSLRRSIRQGPFEQADLGTLTAQLPLIRAMAGMTQLMNGIFDARPQDARNPRCLFGFEPDGTAFMLETSAATPDVLSVRHGRLVTTDPAQAPRVKDAIRRARATGAPASTVLTDGAGHLYVFTMVPATEMLPTGMTQMSWASVVSLTSSQAPGPERLRKVMSDLGLSAAEARVALLVGEARTIEDTAQALGTSAGTVRNHLKSVFAKVGVRRQAELVAILGRV